MRSLTALVYTIVNKYKNFISSQHSENQAIGLENEANCTTDSQRRNINVLTIAMGSL